MAERILRAKHLFLGNGEQIRNGMLRLSAEGRILDLGIFEVKGKIEEYEALCPAFINTHCHLELSHLHHKVPMHEGLHEFIPSLQAQRESTATEIEAAIEKWDEEMRKEGIVAVGDITNGRDSLRVKQSSSIHYHSFIELFGLREHKAEAILNGGIQLKKDFMDAGLSASLSPHSPYSVSTPLFQGLMDNEQEGPISIHNQESKAELDLFEGVGKLKEMLTNFGNTEDSLPKHPKGSLARALEFIPSSRKTLLVHNTFTEADDIEWATEKHKKLYWCFCPSANWYIEKTLANIPLFIEKGLSCTLGTDSLASNHQLSILEEMKLIQQHYPSVPTALLMQWGCANGAEFLGLDYGKFERGQLAKINSILHLKDDGSLTKDSIVQALF